jgi:hypothetical protein
VRAQAKVDRRWFGNVADAVVRLARKQGAVIALASRSGAVSATLLGSTARQVLRASSQPVWILHPVPTDAPARADGHAGSPKPKAEPQPEYLV